MPNNEQRQLPVTIAIPVKNEAINLPACLKCLGEFEKVVVMISGSTDGTVEIAKKEGVELLQFRWQGGFPKKRNWFLMNYNFATEWVLFVDADERVTSAFKGALGECLRATTKVGFWINYSNYFLNRRLKHGVPQRKLALIRVGRGLYERIEDPGWSGLDMEVHEHPIMDGEVGVVDEPLDHQDWRGLHNFIARHNEYSSWEARRCVSLMQNSKAWMQLTRRQKLKYRFVRTFWFAPAYFIFTYVIKRGFADGTAGFMYASLKAFYFIQIRAKIIELELVSKKGADPHSGILA